MSSRQLRKLQQQRELEEQAKVQAQREAVDEESEEEPVIPTKFKTSLFANLAALRDNEDEQEDDQEDEKEDEQEEEVEKVNPAPTSKKSKKSKKKKSKNKTKEKPEPKNDADDIDAALRGLNLNNPFGNAIKTHMQANPEFERVCALLGVSTQHLKVANEMRSLFGRGAVDVGDEPGGPAGRGARRRQRGQNQQVDLETALKGKHAPGKGLPELTLRRNNLIQGKDDWPKATTGGLTMVLVDDQREHDGTVEFRFDHNQMYQTVQQEFNGYVEIGDPQNLIGLLIQNPYHISLLIQVSKIAKDQGDHALSSDLLERALFTFGRAAVTLFNTQLSIGKVRMDFARPENREFWLAGYQYIKSLVMKGTYGTALEWAKLLLSLDPEDDPYCMRLMVHHLAIRAGKFEWILDVFESTLPQTWTYLEDYEHSVISHIIPSLAIAAMHLKDGARCRQLLSKSMQVVPWLFCQLFKELDLSAPPPIWGVEPRTGAERLFTEIYILQTKDLWNTPEATSLLMEIAHTISKPALENIPLLADSEMTLDVVRFVYLDNTPALMALAPSSLLHRSNNSDADPLPPNSNIFSYASQRAVLRGNVDGGNDDGFLAPLAAMVRLFPVLPGGNEDRDHQEIRGLVDDGTRRELEQAIAGEVPDGDSRVPPSLAARLLAMLWQPRNGGEEGGDDEVEYSGTDTDSDADIPELIGYEDSGDEDEMPALIDQ